MISTGNTVAFRVGGEAVHNVVTLLSHAAVTSGIVPLVHHPYDSVLRDGLRGRRSSKHADNNATPELRGGYYNVKATFSTRHGHCVGVQTEQPHGRLRCRERVGAAVDRGGKLFLYIYNISK